MTSINLILFIIASYMAIEIGNCTKHNHMASLTGNDFIDAYHQKNTFVDKTILLEQFVHTDDTNAHLLTCPDRFGKTTNLKMIESFFELHSDSNNDPIITDATQTPNYKIFSNLEVGQNTDLMKNHFAQYYVLYLNLDKLKGGKTYNNQSIEFYDNIADCISKYDWIAKKLMKDQSISLDAIVNLKKYFKVTNGVAENTYELIAGITSLMALLKTYHERGVILLVDNYEAPLLEALHQKTGHDNVINILKNIYFQCYKMAPKYIMFAGVSSTLFQHASPQLDFLRHFHFLDEHRWHKFCGFEEKHVDDLINRNQMWGNKIELKIFYNGYKVKNKDVILYSPSPIIEIIKNNSLLQRKNENLPPHWTPTGVFQYLRDCYVNNHIRHVIGDLVNGSTFQLEDVPCVKHNTKRLDFLQNLMSERCQRIKEFHESLFFTYLFEHGYFKYSNSSEYNVFHVSNENMNFDLAMSLRNFYADETIVSNHIASEVIHEIIYTPGETPAPFHYNVTSGDFPRAY